MGKIISCVTDQAHANSLFPLASFKSLNFLMVGNCSTSLKSSSSYAIYRLICHLNLWKRIDKRGVRNEHLNNRFLTIASNGETSIIDHQRLATSLRSSEFLISIIFSRSEVRLKVSKEKRCLIFYRWHLIASSVPRLGDPPSWAQSSSNLTQLNVYVST